VSWLTETSAEAATGAAEEPVASGAPLTIAEVRSQTGLSARTLRYYEEVGLLPGVRRRAGGRRVYGTDELERLRFIGRLKTLGLTLAEIKELNAVYGIAGSTGAMLSRLDELLARHLGDLDARIAELETLRGEIRRYRERVAARHAAADNASKRRTRA
jgi:DNA-binding transcriptional MerR regulator